MTTVVQSSDTLQPDPTTPFVDISSLTPEAALTKKPRPHCKIAKLPKPLRDQINTGLDDGLSYPRIREKLEQSTDPPLPYPINDMDISRWKDGGYQIYLTQQERIAYIRASRETATDLVTGEDTTLLAEAALQIIAAQYFDLPRRFLHTRPKAKARRGSPQIQPVS
jgi:hypothetical protein